MPSDHENREEQDEKTIWDRLRLLLLPIIRLLRAVNELIQQTRTLFKHVQDGIRLVSNLISVSPSYVAVGMMVGSSAIMTGAVVGGLAVTNAGPFSESPDCKLARLPEELDIPPGPDFEQLKPGMALGSRYSFNAHGVDVAITSPTGSLVTGRRSHRIDVITLRNDSENVDDPGLGIAVNPPLDRIGLHFWAADSGITTAELTVFDVDDGTVHREVIELSDPYGFLGLACNQTLAKLNLRYLERDVPEELDAVVYPWVR